MSLMGAELLLVVVEDEQRVVVLRLPDHPVEITGLAAASEDRSDEFHFAPPSIAGATGGTIHACRRRRCTCPTNSRRQ
jgi:hypothetical protein